MIIKRKNSDAIAKNIFDSLRDRFDELKTVPQLFLRSSDLIYVILPHVLSHEDDCLQIERELIPGFTQTQTVRIRDCVLDQAARELRLDHDTITISKDYFPEMSLECQSTQFVIGFYSPHAHILIQGNMHHTSSDAYFLL